MSIKSHVDKKSKETISRRMDTVFDNIRGEIESAMIWLYNFAFNFIVKPIFLSSENKAWIT